MLLRLNFFGDGKADVRGSSYPSLNQEIDVSNENPHSINKLKKQQGKYEESETTETASPVEKISSSSLRPVGT